MNRRFFRLFFLAAASLAAGLGMASTAPGSIHDPLGRAGMVAVALPAGGENEAALWLMVGGANFPHALPGAKTPAERGEKVFYDEVAVAPVGEGESSEPHVVGKLPRPVGYAAYAATERGVFIAGGCNAEGHIAKACCLSLHEGSELRVSALPDLPRSVAYPAFALVGHKLYVFGGQEKADSTTCLNSSYVLDLDDTNAGWKELAPMPSGRMLAAAGVVDGVVYVMGGCSLASNAAGEAVRSYLSDVLCYDPGSNTWAKVNTEMPESIVGMATPLPVVSGRLYVVGGDPGCFYRASLAGEAPAEHPGQSKRVYSFTPSSGEWKQEGELPLGVATMPAVVVGDVIYTISGETHPGVRTPRVLPFHTTH